MGMPPYNHKDIFQNANHLKFPRAMHVHRGIIFSLISSFSQNRFLNYSYKMEKFYYSRIKREVGVMCRERR